LPVRRRSHRKSPHLLFLSHRSTDKTIVSAIATSIKNQGVNIWFDKEQLVPSQSLTAEISSALDRMTAFVLFWSSSCVGAPWVERELNSAIALLIEKSIPLIIVRLDDTPIPSIVADIFRIESRGETADDVGKRISDAVKKLQRNIG
jgi:TIR domain-containing protein